MRQTLGTDSLKDPGDHRWPLWINVENGEVGRRILDGIHGISGWTVREAASLAHLTAVQESDASAILCFAQPTPASHLNAIRVLKQKSWFVLCVVNQDETTLQTRSQLLLAGADVLVDAQSDKFVQQLNAVLASEHKTLTHRESEERTLHQLMGRAGFVGRSGPTLSLFRSIQKIAPLSDLPVLITGETGTGKELIASAIHVLDPRRATKPFVATNCAALPAELSESEFFGHCRGAFTGAERERMGVFRSAEGGVLFLDEIGELNVELQAKLLRVLQTRRVRKVGADMEVPIDVRIVAATNRSLDQMLVEGKFREDLLHRLNMCHLCIPPLRERKEDVRPLIFHFVEKHAALWWHKGQPDLENDFIAALEDSALPGNARQLENIVCRSLIDWDGAGPLALRHLPESIWKQVSGRLQQRDTAAPEIQKIPIELQAVEYLQNHDWNLAEAVRDLEAAMVRAAMMASGGNQSEAARLLGITPRSVYNKLHRVQQS